MVVFNDEKQNKQINELRKAEEENLARILSRKYNVEYIDLSIVSINSDALRAVKEEDARKGKLAVFDINEKKIKVGVLAPENDETRRQVAILQEKGYHPTIYMVSTQSLEKVYEYYKDLSYSVNSTGGALDVSAEQIKNFLASVHSLDDVKRLVTEQVGNKKSKVSNMLEIIVAGAIALGASDIHIEPEENSVRTRYRLDGVLTDIISFDHSLFRLLLSRIKLLSGMKLNLSGAQDGRFSINIAQNQIEIRSSILPSAYDESIVLRLLNPESIAVELEALGIPKKLLEKLLHEISKPEGMILTTGPTGSGKTTTLYAFMKKIYTPDIKIITIENPVEYHLPGIVQTQTNQEQGYTFLDGLRSALRQDPDIIMVGEIRDNETAEIAINSALTGHLVFSTLHTNNAAGTFPRLIDLGINPKVLLSAVSIAMAQRLVRKLCPVCKKKVLLEKRNKQIVDRIVKSIKNLPEYIETVPDSVYEPVGCKECNSTGYQGRIGIYEAIARSEALEQVILNNPSEREIWKAAEPQGILNLKQDGILKVLNGVTSMPELERVVDLEEGI